MYFLNINKPKNMSSFDVIRFLRKKLNIRQIGHSGTLDPLASGVLQVALGQATKLLDYLKSDKTYIADIIFGYTSETYDDEGEKTFIKTPDFKKSDLENALKSFLGKSLQIPPKYSAIKIQGKKLCDLARKNKLNDITITPREIEIYSLELLEFIKDKNITKAKVKISAKKGIYIRSFAYDLGQKLLCGAYIKDLKRIQAGDFRLLDSDELDSENYRKINPLDVLDIQKYETDDNEYKKIMNGVFICPKPDCALKEGEVLLTKNNKLVSIANLSDNLIRPKKNFKEV